MDSGEQDSSKALRYLFLYHLSKLSLDANLNRENCSGMKRKGVERKFLSPKTPSHIFISVSTRAPLRANSFSKLLPHSTDFPCTFFKNYDIF